MWKILSSPIIFIFKKLTWILNSFSLKENGASRRALTAFFSIVIVGGWITYTFTNKDNATTMLIIWLSLGALCLSLITGEQLVKLKNGGSDQPTSPQENANK